MSKYLCIVICILLTSCVNNKTQKENKEKSIISNKISIYGNKIPINVIIEPSRIKIDEDLLYISCFRCDTMIYIFSLPDFKLLNSFGQRGNGPEDFLFPVFTNAKNDTIGIWGYADLKKIKQFKTNKKGDLYFLEEFHLDENKAYNQLFKIRDSIVFYNDYPPYLTLKKINLNTSKNQEYYKYKMDKDITNSFFMDNKGDLCISDNHIAYLYYYKHKIDFFDLNLNLIKSYNGSSKKIEINTKDMKESVVYYIHSFAGYKYLYAINNAQPLKNKKESICTLEIFDWYAKMISSIQLKPSVDIFVVDEKRNILYGYNYSIPDYFHQYDLNFINK